MQLDQQEFEGAVEKAKNDLREWFAARTDKAEFKQRPAEPTNPAILANVDKKFGDYVVPPPKKPAPGAKKAGSGSKSGSGGEAGGSSGSNSSDGKSPAPPPSEPKEAAAAAAPAAAPEAAAAAPASN